MIIIVYMIKLLPQISSLEVDHFLHIMTVMAKMLERLKVSLKYVSLICGHANTLLNDFLVVI
jgi:hypothetical protein